MHHGLAEILVRGQDLALWGKFDYRLRARDRLKLTGILDRLLLRGCDIGGEFHHLERLSAFGNGIIGRLDPYFPVAFGEALIGAGVIFAASEPRPEGAIFGRRRIGRLAEHAVVLADDLVEAITKRFAEILVRRENIAVEIEFDDRLRLGDGVKNVFRIGG